MRRFLFATSLCIAPYSRTHELRQPGFGSALGFIEFE